MIAGLLPIFFLLMASAFFSASETAFTSLSFLQIRMLETAKSRTARAAARMAKQSDVLLTTILIGNNIVNLSASALTTTFAISTWGNATIGIATGALTLAILLFGEITPKQLAMNHNVAIVKFAVYPIKAVIILLYPLVIVIKFISSLLTGLFAKSKKETLSVDSLLHVVDVAEDEGIVDEYETSLVQRVLHFSEATVKSIMTHRTDVFSIPASLELQQAFPSVVASGYSRIPVYGSSPEDVSGVLLVRDMLAAIVAGDTDRQVGTLAIEPIYVPETRKVDDMLFQFKHEKQQIAVVLDEYGGLSGIVSLEDIIEQLFGEIYDEHETDTEERIRKDDEGYVIQGDTSMQQLKDELDLDMESVDPSCTLAAYLIERLGTIPIEQDTVETTYGTYSIMTMKGKRIEEVRLVTKQQTEQ